ncbi:ArsR/SmtB family transcription factor [Halalkalibacter alkaliphilus]|uniref:Helix-turn-helix domain-containing protein n=1 Tax=Halalkalibacter alkaliphilus TaxID=2917993 RepID=A0A9X2A6Z3_9BACI|nr:helix-turn-helix domain-containing protein [Halalkalibacter alkaliphilus]MCL7746821.1 helix-turn-helix domain-containing protein [Halalkalibacter alkaliphilus]
MRTLELTLAEAIEVCKALGNEHRMDILRILSEGPMNVNDLSSKLKIPFSTTAVNVKKLEDTKLISTELVPGRGSQKVSSKRYDRIIINLRNDVTPTKDNVYRYEMNVGEFVNCDITPTCGLLSEEGIIHTEDDPRSFFEPERKDAQLIWFKMGFVEYHFPNRIPRGAEVEELTLSAEICSEATNYKEDWPSDITCSINGKEIGLWTSPGDFGGVRGNLTPSWWGVNNTQFGLLKKWKITSHGCYLDGEKISDITIQDLNIEQQPYISFKIEVKENAKNLGGINIFGSKFGNYEQALILNVNYR